MGKLLNGYILPHPPVIVPGIGQKREMKASATIDAVKKVADEIKEDKPTTIIISTPHAPSFRDFVYISDIDILSGDFSAFGSPDIRFSFKNNLKLASLIAEKADLAGIRAGGLSALKKKQYGITDQLDHGSLVPLYYVSKELRGFRLINISTPFLTLTETYEFGKCIQEAIRDIDERVVYIASGDLSHRLTVDAPAGYNPKGKEYDEALVDKIRRGDVQGLLNIEESFIEKAGECGTRSIVMMFGALHGLKYEPEIYSYEGPFGVGYMVAKINVLSDMTRLDPEENDNAAKAENKDLDQANHEEENHEAESVYVKLAREALEYFVRNGEKIDVPKWVPPEFKKKRAGVFVSLKKDGALRGCIGTIGPVQINIAEEIISNAVSSGTQDPRFPSVTVKELKDLVYSIDVLGPPEEISSMDELDVKRYGVIVTSGFRRGLLLPDLEGIDTPEQQVGVALLKAGISQKEDYHMERFEVIRYK